MWESRDRGRAHLEDSRLNRRTLSLVRRGKGRRGETGKPDAAARRPKGRGRRNGWSFIGKGIWGKDSPALGLEKFRMGCVRAHVLGMPARWALHQAGTEGYRENRAASVGWL